MGVGPDLKVNCRCSTADLDNERGAVMEEWRSGKDSRGRVAEAQWKMVMHGTKVWTQLACCEVLIAAAVRLSLLHALEAVTSAAKLSAWTSQATQALSSIWCSPNVSSLLPHPIPLLLSLSLKVTCFCCLFYHSHIAVMLPSFALSQLDAHGD